MGAYIGWLHPYQSGGMRCWIFRNVDLNQGAFCKFCSSKQSKWIIPRGHFKNEYNNGVLHTACAPFLTGYIWNSQNVCYWLPLKEFCGPGLVYSPVQTVHLLVRLKAAFPFCHRRYNIVLALTTAGYLPLAHWLAPLLCETSSIGRAHQHQSGWYWGCSQSMVVSTGRYGFIHWSHYLTFVVNCISWCFLVNWILNH